LEDYFNQPESELKKDERPELSYQVGVTLENTEKPKCAVDEPCLRIIARLDPAERPLDITAHSPDPKCRFFWKIGEKPPYQTMYPALNAPNVVPQAEHLSIRWGTTMEAWGKAMKDAYVVSLVQSAIPHDLADSVENLAEMTAVGLGFPEDTFRNAGRYGYVYFILAKIVLSDMSGSPHLLAPTAANLVKYGEKNTILAGFHSDLNFLTIHGRSRYPGLHIWARNTGKRILVKFPQTGRYLLVQAGKQLEHLTGGLIKAGFHEVVVNEATAQVISQQIMTLNVDVTTQTGHRTTQVRVP
jgi:hypothetical protein